MNSKLLFKIHFSTDTDDMPSHPDEDAIVADDRIAAVFDGVTLLHQDPYPDPSPAAQAAVRGAKTAVAYAKAHPDEVDFIKNSFVAANHAIRQLNESLAITAQTVDFLKVQYAAAVGALAAVQGSTLHYGQINDCGVMICAPTGEILDNLIADTSRIRPFVERARREHGFTAGSPKEHIFVRSQLINNPNAELDGELMNDGVLTGEEIATDYVNAKQMELTNPVKVVVYSDGFVTLLDQPDFRRALFGLGSKTKAKEFIEKYRQTTGALMEASLVIIDIRSEP